MKKFPSTLNKGKKNVNEMDTNYIYIIERICDLQKALLILFFKATFIILLILQQKNFFYVAKLLTKVVIIGHSPYNSHLLTLKNFWIGNLVNLRKITELYFEEDIPLWDTFKLSPQFSSPPATCIITSNKVCFCTVLYYYL